MLKNRIEKNWKKIKNWSEQQSYEAVRLYDRDIPEYQFIVDKYKDHFVVYDKTDAIIDQNKNLVPQVLQAIQDLFPLQSPEHLILKQRLRRARTEQYEKTDDTKRFIVVREGRAQLLVNLWDYLDTGLFLDHRPLREKIHKQSQGKSFLNLFCYTGAVSVAAALGGARTVSVDMSATYLDWARRNFQQNQLSTKDHEFIETNALEWLHQPTTKQKFDMIFLDPPTFSNSKKMDGTFDVERDQVFLIHQTIRLLNPDGVLYFSNNKRSFKLDPEILASYHVSDISKATIPRDFHDQKIHQCYRISAKNSFVKPNTAKE